MLLDYILGDGVVFDRRASTVGDFRSWCSGLRVRRIVAFICTAVLPRYLGSLGRSPLDVEFFDINLVTA